MGFTIERTYTSNTKLIFVIASVILGLLLMVSMLVIFIALDPIPTAAEQAARTLLSLGAGFTAAGLGGSIEWKSNMSGVIISATGGFVIFLVVYFIQPGMIGLLGLS